jgi:radical SAM superfamily enzyme YgiQ (UPF0313 family)
MTPKSVLFIRPGTNEQTRENSSTIFIAPRDPGFELGLSYLVAVLKKEIPDVREDYVDFQIEREDQAEDILASLINENGTTHVGITCYSHHYLSAMKLAKLIKTINPAIVNIAGGFHPTIRPNDFITPDSNFDYIVRGEGEVPIINIIKNQLPTRKHPIIIRGRARRELSSLPSVDLGLFMKYQKLIDFSDLPVFFSRGCTHDCSFCMARDETKDLKLYRALDHDGILAQLDAIEQYHPKRITIMDPIFGVNPTWFRDVVGLLGRRNRNYDVRLEMHLDLLDENKLAMLVGNGIDLTVGFETASRDMLTIMNKTRDPSRYLAKTILTIKSYNRSGRALMLNLLFGHPGETLSTLKDTFQFLADSSSKMDGISLKFSLFRLYPGTDVFNNSANYSAKFGSRFFFKNWWYQDLDYSIVPSLIDPSFSLDLIHEITSLREMFDDLIKKIGNDNGNIDLTQKLILYRYLSKINRTYGQFKERASDLRSLFINEQESSKNEKIKGEPSLA